MMSALGYALFLFLCNTVAMHAILYVVTFDDCRSLFYMLLLLMTVALCLPCFVLRFCLNPTPGHLGVSLLIPLPVFSLLV